MSAGEIPHVEIRQAAPADFAAVSALLKQARLPTADLTAGHMARFRVAQRNSQIIGAVGYQPLPDGNALIRSLVVEPGYRGRGLGERLFAEIESVCRTQQATMLYLLTDTAAPFFHSLGFSELARDQAPQSVRATAEFSSLCPDGATCMSRPI